MRLTLRLLAGVAAILCICGPALADGLIVIDRAPDRPDHFAFAPLEVSYHRVEVSIDDRVATTRVDQEFFNRNNQRLEGTYLFPLPEGATIDKFSMDIDGTMTEAELLDAKKARSTYEEIVRRYRDPALLEYVGRGAMKVRIFPIEPRSPKRIKINYTQVLKADSNVMEYTYPLNTEKFSSTPLKDLSVRIKLNSKTPIKSVYCPTHEVEVRRNGDREITVGFEARNTRPDTDFKLIVTREPDPIGVSLLSYRNRSGDGYFMLMASPGTDAGKDGIQSKDICFVIDTSGSMAGEKLEQAKKALKFCLANLNTKDRFEIIRFSTDAEALFTGLKPASKDNIDRAGEFVEQLKPIGGTAISDALKLALEVPGREDRDAAAQRSYSVIFLTDGQPTVGETNEDQIVRAFQRQSDALSKNNTRVRIFPFGIGTDINTTLLDRMANETHAFTQYVLPKEDIEVKVSNFYTKIQSPVLSNVKFTCDNPDVRLTQVYPGELPDLFQGETLLAFGKYTLSGGRDDVKAKITLSGTVNGARRETVSEVTFNGNNTHDEFIPRLWATRRVGWLLDEIRLHGESVELKDEITQLARAHGIVTPYTAYLILEDERRRNVPVPMQTMRELSRDRRAAGEVDREYKSMAADSALQERAGAQAVTNAEALNSLKGFAGSGQAGGFSGGLAKSGAGGRGARGDGQVAFDPVGAPMPATQPAAPGYRAPQNYAQQVKLVNGRAFYQNGTTWTDNTAQTGQNLKRQEVKFNSDDYFALLAKYPSAIPWFSLGNEVDVVIEDTLYVVR